LRNRRVISASTRCAPATHHAVRVEVLVLTHEIYGEFNEQSRSTPEKPHWLRRFSLECGGISLSNFCPHSSNFLWR
jgi:hypothetical protein